jgi:uncharacterized protein (DUF58 family)
VLLRRPDLVIVGAPLALGAAVALAGRPRAVPEVDLAVPADAVLEGDRLAAVVTVAAPDRVDVASVELRTPPWVEPDGTPLRQAVRVGAAEEAEISFRLRSTRWGRRRLGPAVLRATGGYGMLHCGPYESGTGPLTTWPLRQEFVATDAVPRAAGLVGLHRSRRSGEGTDLASVRPFVPGDRLRRINWRVTARTRDLHVTATYSDRDAEVLLCLDSRYDFGRTPDSSLDMTVRAAAAVAEHYLRAGDRVGLVDLGQLARRVPAANGRAHLVRILDLLLDVRPARRSDGTGRETMWVAGHDVPAGAPEGALVVVLSPLAGEAIFRVLAVLSRSGRAVVVVDTLPPGARPLRRGPWTDLAHRIWALDRASDLARLAELGLPVVQWRGAGSLDQVLRDVSRAARAARLPR